MVRDDKISRVIEYVDMDLNEIQHDNYSGIIKKMKLVSSSSLSDALAILNFGILDMMSEQKSDEKPGDNIIPITKYQTTEIIKTNI